MKTVETVKGQAILDLAIQEYGNPEAIWEIINKNPSLKNDFGEDGPLVDDVVVLDLGYPLLAGQQVVIDTSSRLMRRSIVSELSGHVISE